MPTATAQLIDTPAAAPPAAVADGAWLCDEAPALTLEGKVRIAGGRAGAGGGGVAGVAGGGWCAWVVDGAWQS
jgi:hypothetical protein